jgi:hypothetical protein
MFGTLTSAPPTMIKAWFSRERIPRTNIRVSYMHVLHTQKPQGELKIHQLWDNIRRHQFVERDGTIWIGIRAATRGNGRICSFPLPLAWPCPVPSHFPINLSTLLTLSLCRSYRDPTPSLFSKEVKSKQSSSCGV